MSKPEREMRGTEAWVYHHHERGRLAAEEDFATLDLRSRWSGSHERSDGMEKRSWLRTMAELLAVADD